FDHLRDLLRGGMTVHDNEHRSSGFGNQGSVDKAHCTAGSGSWAVTALRSALGMLEIPDLCLHCLDLWLPAGKSARKGLARSPGPRRGRKEATAYREDPSNR